MALYGHTNGAASARVSGPGLLRPVRKSKAWDCVTSGFGPFVVATENLRDRAADPDIPEHHCSRNHWALREGVAQPH